MRHIVNYSRFLLESTDPEHTKPAKYFNEDSWKKALDSASGDLKSIKKTLDKIAGDLSKRYPKIKWDVVANADAYTGVCFGYDLTMKLPGWLSKRFISMDVCFKSRKMHDFDNAMSVDGLQDKPYTLDVYYYREIEAYGEKQLDNNPTKSESSDKPYTIKQVQAVIADMDTELTLLKDRSLKEGKVADLGKWLDKKTGLDADERDEWRDTVSRLRDEVDEEKDETKKKALKAETLRVLQSFSYWKENYQSKQSKRKN